MYAKFQLILITIWRWIYIIALEPHNTNKSNHTKRIYFTCVLLIQLKKETKTSPFNECNYRKWKFNEMSFDFRLLDTTTITKADSFTFHGAHNNANTLQTRRKILGKSNRKKSHSWNVKSEFWPVCGIMPWFLL